MFTSWLVIVGATFGSLLPITNPFSTAPVFAASTQGFSESRRKQQARMAVIYMVAILWVALLAGALILEFFGISVAGMRIAGGLIVARVGFGMLNPEPHEELTDEQKHEAARADDIAFTPIAMPLLSGPGSIAVTISMASTADVVSDYLGIAVGIALVAVFAWIVLRSSTAVMHRLGRTGMSALTRLMGFILACIGVQFVLTGLYEALTDEALLRGLFDAFRSAGALVC